MYKDTSVNPLTAMNNKVIILNALSWFSKTLKRKVTLVRFILCPHFKIIKHIRTKIKRFPQTHSLYMYILKRIFFSVYTYLSMIGLQVGCESLVVLF